MIISLRNSYNLFLKKGYNKENVFFFLSIITDALKFEHCVQDVLKF